MFFEYNGLLSIHPRWYELPLGICRNGDVSQAPARAEEHDARDAVCLYKETMREYILEFGDPSMVERKLMRHVSEIAVRAAVVQSGDVAKVARIDVREVERRKWKAYHCKICKACSKPSKANNGC